MRSRGMEMANRVQRVLMAERIRCAEAAERVWLATFPVHAWGGKLRYTNAEAKVMAAQCSTWPAGMPRAAIEFDGLALDGAHVRARTTHTAPRAIGLPVPEEDALLLLVDWDAPSQRAVESVAPQSLAARAPRLHWARLGTLDAVPYEAMNPPAGETHRYSVLIFDRPLTSTRMWWPPVPRRADFPLCEFVARNRLRLFGSATFTASQ